jgi:diguanylate cyclase (GGDEF)-like protein
LAFVAVYNTYYQLTYRRLGNIAILNHAQLMFDATVVGVLVYYSGGVYSWFAAMFMLFILEGAFILPRQRDVWILTGYCTLIYTGILVAELAGWLPHVNVPFVDNDLQMIDAYVWVRALWTATMMAGAAVIGGFMMNAIRSRERLMEETSVRDRATGLYNRAYFRGALRSEVLRARRSGGSVAVVLVDVDHLDRLNRLFGFDAGNRMLETIASELKGVFCPDGDPGRELNVACRHGGEEFAAIVPGATGDEVGVAELARDAARLAETFRRHVEGVREGEMSVTVSAGVAVFPRDASSVDDLMDAADMALSAASAAGGNQVVAEPPSEVAED